jgi:hypothetical protein
MCTMCTNLPCALDMFSSSSGRHARALAERAPKNSSAVFFLLVRFPPWPYMKLLFCCWLVLPIFNGAAYIYEAHVRRYFKIGSYVSPSYSERHRRVLQMTSLDARRSVERFIDTHGPDALDRIIRAVSSFFFVVLATRLVFFFWGFP